MQTAHWEIDYQAGHLCVWSKSDGAQECPPGSSHPSHCPTYLGLKDTTGTDKETDWKDKGTTRRSITCYTKTLLVCKWYLYLLFKSSKVEKKNQTKQTKRQHMKS